MRKLSLPSSLPKKVNDWEIALDIIERQEQGTKLLQTSLGVSPPLADHNARDRTDLDSNQTLSETATTLPASSDCSTSNCDQQQLLKHQIQQQQQQQDLSSLKNPAVTTIPFQLSPASTLSLQQQQHQHLSRTSSKRSIDQVDGPSNDIPAPSGAITLSSGPFPPSPAPHSDAQQQQQQNDAISPSPSQPSPSFLAETTHNTHSNSATADEKVEDPIITQLLRNRGPMTDVSEDAESERRKRMYVMLRYSHSYKRIQVEGANTRWAAAAAAFEQFQQEQGVQPDQSSADQDQDLVMITREVSSVDHDGSMNNTISTAEGPVPFKRQGSEKPLQSALRSRRSSERPTISLSLHQDVSSSALVVPIIPSSLPVVTNSHFLDCESDNYTSSSPSRTTDSSLYSSSSPSKLTNPLNLIKPSQSHHPAALPLESTPTPQTENLPQALPLSYTPTIDDATQPTRRSSLSSAQPEQTRRGQRKVSFSSNVTMIKDPRPLLLLQTVPSAISSTAMDEDPSASMSSLASSPSVASVENTDTTGARLLGALRETAQKVRRSSSHALSSLSGSSMSVASPHGSVLSLKKGKMDAATPVERMEMEGVVFVENVEKGGERIEVEEDGGVGGRKRQGKWRGWWIGVVRVFGRGKKRMTGKK